MRHWPKTIVAAVETFWLGPADPRVYALIRIAFSAVALLNLLDLWPHRLAFFSSAGMIDLETLRANIGSEPYYSVFFYLTSPSAVTAYFLFTALAMLCLALGVLPRWSAIWVFVWHLSYTYRAFPVMHGWDVILRLIAFIVMISPMDRTWTVYALVSRGPARRQLSLPRYGLVLLQIQLAVIYWNTVWLKLLDPHWRDGEFISYFMLSLYSRFPLPMMADLQVLSCLLTYGTLIVEAVIPALLFFRRSRGLAFVLGAGLHFGILVASILWLFSLVIMVPYLAFLDGQDLDHVSERMRRWSVRFRAHAQET